MWVQDPKTLLILFIPFHGVRDILCVSIHFFLRWSRFFSFLVRCGRGSGREIFKYCCWYNNQFKIMGLPVGANSMHSFNS